MTITLIVPEKAKQVPLEELRKDRLECIRDLVTAQAAWNLGLKSVDPKNDPEYRIQKNVKQLNRLIAERTKQ